MTGVRRVGHAGTLDPLATGVLLVCLGRATRIAEYLMAGRKTYRAGVRLGCVTNTYDAEGEVTARAPVDVRREGIERVLEAFTGVIEQVPPMYSAVKHRGTPLYRLARQGIEVERQPRAVEIFHLELITWEAPDLVIELTCSSGTYVRTLAHDIGQALGCGAYLASLTRLASGRFRQEDALSPQEFGRAVAEERWEALLHPLDAALYAFPAVYLSREEAYRLCSGRAVGASVEGLPPQDDALGRAYGPEGEFLAVVAYDPPAGVWRPRKVFCAERVEDYATGP